jgi:hypothetical protein
MGRLLLNSALGLIGSAAIAVPALMVASYQPTMGERMARESGGEFHPTPPAYELARLRKLAEAGCKCARLSGGKEEADSCWQTFDEASRNTFRSHTACIPLSEMAIVFDDSSEQVILAYDIVLGGNESGTDFCTREEAVTAEALAASIDNGRGNQAEQNAAMDRAVAAMERLSREFARGRQVAHAERGYGCAGG